MTTEGFQFRPFVVAADDPLAAEHALVSRWAEEAVAALGEGMWYQNLDLKELASGRALLQGDTAQSKRYLMAAIAQVRHCDAEVTRARAQATNEFERCNVHTLPGWARVWGRRRHASAVVAALMRRALRLEERDLTAILGWCVEEDRLSRFHAPVGLIVKAVQRYAAAQPLSPATQGLLQRFAVKLHESHEKDIKRFGTVVEQLCASSNKSGPGPDQGAESDMKAPPPRPQIYSPAPAGNLRVLKVLKEVLGIAAHPTGPISEEAVGPDRYRLLSDSPLRTEHQLLTNLFKELLGVPAASEPDVTVTVAGRPIPTMTPEARGRLVLAAAERVIAALLDKSGLNENWRANEIVLWTFRHLNRISHSLDRDDLFDMLLFVSSFEHAQAAFFWDDYVRGLIGRVREEAATQPLSDGERHVLYRLRQTMVVRPQLGNPHAPSQPITDLLEDRAVFFFIPGEAWTDALNRDLSALSDAQRQAWIDLIRHALTAPGSRPSAKWLKTARQHLGTVDQDCFSEALRRWLPLVPAGRSFPLIRRHLHAAEPNQLMHSENADCLRGLLWMAPLAADADLARLIGSAAVSCYQKVPGVGPRATRVGNAAIYALSEMHSDAAVAQLAMLKVRVRFGTAQKEIEKAFAAAAARLNIPRDEIEEMGVPSYGMEQVGLRRETLGDFAAELRITGSDVELAWFDADGKPRKSAPKKVTDEFKEDLKELKGAQKDMAAMLPAQAVRIDSLYLSPRAWPAAVWRERYLDHPLVGTVARRFLWCFRDGDRERVGVWDGKRLVDVKDQPIEPGDAITVELWHPIGRTVEEVLAWREWLEKHEIRQPFKQAHREVYVLTDAERNTRVYSNRFAAHVLKQHQFNALCAARGWKNKLRLMVDDEYPPAHRFLPVWNLRAEYWIEGVGEDYGTDTNESGVYLYVTTDQVRFYRQDAAMNTAHAGGGGYGRLHEPADEPLALSEVSPLVFSEVMRDVDLFVGVASVGNDPNWLDGAHTDTQRGYWHRVSFGDLSATAQTRKAVLERLVPRLKIRDRCTFSDKFLVVRGDLRTYKIHLGSGNILMEPNDQYLCIVPKAAAVNAVDGKVFLPFEGDRTLSIILSKAMMLAEDAKITDATITRQIKAR